jgi:hypothetical protein
VTWVLGAATPFGYAALISDTRVTWRGGQHADILQKIYPVAKNVIAGFAGSVDFGFWAIDDMQRVMVEDVDVPARRSRIPLRRWRRRARYAFRSAPAEVRRLGAQLILARSIPTKGGIASQCVTMEAPEFLPVVVPGLKWASIGSGASSRRARELADQHPFGESQSGMMQGEVMNPGGYAMTVGHAVAYGLFHDPVEGVSDLLQVGIARTTGPVIRGLMTHYNVGAPTSTARNTPRDICTSWAAFQQQAKIIGSEACAAVAMSV